MFFMLTLDQHNQHVVLSETVEGKLHYNGEMRVISAFGLGSYSNKPILLGYRMLYKINC
jgi:hypothetical protein